MGAEHDTETFPALSSKGLGWHPTTEKEIDTGFHRMGFNMSNRPSGVRGEEPVYNGRMGMAQRCSGQLSDTALCFHCLLSHPPRPLNILIPWGVGGTYEDNMESPAPEQGLPLDSGSPLNGKGRSHCGNQYGTSSKKQK